MHVCSIVVFWSVGVFVNIYFLYFLLLLKYLNIEYLVIFTLTGVSSFIITRYVISFHPELRVNRKHAYFYRFLHIRVELIMFLLNIKQLLWYKIFMLSEVQMLSKTGIRTPRTCWSAFIHPVLRYFIFADQSKFEKQNEQMNN